jgi:hypothetical protein
MLSRQEPLPVYVEQRPEPVQLPATEVLPPASVWTTLYISGGKKDKLSKVDIVGFLSQKGGLGKDDLGKIEMLDFMSFVAVKKTVVKQLLQQIAQEKMKGKKYKIQLAW